MEEEYRPIKDYPNYLVSNLGNIKRIDGTPMPGYFNTKYMKIALKNSEGFKHHYIHKLVLTTFVPNTDPSKKLCDHINRKKLDNRACNLRWVSHKENMGNRTSRGYLKVQSNGMTYYYAKIQINGETFLMKADSAEEAVALHRAMHIDYYGELSPYYLGLNVDE